MAKKGTKLSEEHKQQIRDALRGRPKNYTVEQLANLSSGLREGWRRRKEELRALEEIYYVYIVFCSLGYPLYVGKGSGDRAFRDLTCDNNQLGEIAKQSLIELPVVLFRENLSEEEAYRLERFLIQIIGKQPNGTLINLAKGGLGGTGTRKSPLSAEEKAALAERNRNRIWTEEMRNKSRQSHLGQVVSEDNKNKASERMLGNTYGLGVSPSIETRQKMSASHQGKSVNAGKKWWTTPDGEIYRSEFPRSELDINGRGDLRGRTATEEHRNNISKALAGKPKSEEHLRNIELGKQKAKEARTSALVDSFSTEEHEVE